MKQFFLFIFIGAGLTACSFGKQSFVSGKYIEIDSTLVGIAEIDSIVQPYKIELDKEMNKKIAFAEVNFERNRPTGNLGNLIADILLEEGNKHIQGDERVVCLLNHGGLRSPINQGDVTLGDVFKVLPFDNQVVIVKLPGKTMEKIKNYMLISGGEPISGFRIRDENVIDYKNKYWNQTVDFWVVTSDYLMNGGDKMTFFEDRIDVKYTGLFMRDIIIEYLQKNPIIGNRKDLRIY